jgi:multidrug efflux system membrane fusion protein
MFDNADGKLFPQEFVNIRLLVRTLPQQTTVPSAAIQRGADGSFVYVVNKDRTVSVRNVTLGPTDNDKVDIRSGLRPGEIIVVDGADRLKDGAKISIPGLLPKGSVYGSYHHSGAHRHHHYSE